MFLIKETLVLCTCLVLLACGENTVKEPPQPNTKAFAPIKTENNTVLPFWVEDHRLANYLSVIGSSDIQKIGGEQAQYNVAMQKARDKLRIEFQKNRDDFNAVKRKNSNYQSQDEINESIETLMLENAIVQAEWTHPETGRIYLWLIIPDH